MACLPPAADAPHPLGVLPSRRERPRGCRAAEPPIHAPAAIAGTGLAKQVLERRPQIGREPADCELDATFLLCHVAPAQFIDLRLGLRRNFPVATDWVNDCLPLIPKI